MVLLAAAALAGCASTAERAPPDLQEVRDVFGRRVRVGSEWSGSSQDGVRVPTQTGPDAWTIVLLVADAPGKAGSLLNQVRSVGRLPDAFVMERNGRDVVAVGSYADPSSQVAQIELERVRSITIDGVRPYERAFLAPPSGDLSRGSIPEYDLRNARARYGEAALYTLQIAVYGREDDKPVSATDREQFRAAAEDAAVALRQGGELAFYYHGPNRSMVTVGIFGEKDLQLEQGIPTESARLTLARDRHPLNLLNGRTIVEKVRSSTGGMIDRDQSSFLVSVPK